MLQTAFLDLEKILKKSKLNKNEIQLFIKIFSHYRKGQYIYPGAISRYTHIEIVKIYDALNTLEKYDWTESYFEVLCSSCKHSTGLIYKSINDIPADYECDFCEHKDNALKSSILIYKVLYDGK